MIKWFAYIVFLLIFVPNVSLGINKNYHFFKFKDDSVLGSYISLADTGTTKNNKKQIVDDKGKIKEVTKAKKQPKPEKVEAVDNANNIKPRPKRQRRPEGLERPPEIPRRNGN
jgi:hypothetical protein